MITPQQQETLIVIISFITSTVMGAFLVGMVQGIVPKSTPVLKEGTK